MRVVGLHTGVRRQRAGLPGCRSGNGRDGILQRGRAFAGRNVSRRSGGNRGRNGRRGRREVPARRSNARIRGRQGRPGGRTRLLQAAAAAQGMIWGLMALGVFITFRVLDIADLTVDGSFATGGAVTVMLLLAGWPSWAALLAAFAAGVLTGLVTGLLHTKLGIPAILAGILTQFSLYSINLRIMTKANQTASIKKFGMFWEGPKGFLLSSLYVPQAIAVGFVLAVVAIALLYWYFGTEQGSAMRATGSNPAMSRAQGINVDFNKVLGLMISNGLVALASALYCQYQGFADVNAGRGAIVIGLAAVIIGEVLFSRIFRNFALRLLGVSLGAVVYYLVIQVVLNLGLNTNDLKLISAFVVAIFLAVPYWKGKYFRGAAKSAAKTDAKEVK